MIAYVFPGQGSQTIGMGLEFYNEFPIARQTFEEASDTLKFDLAKLCFDGSLQELNLTANAQPALLTTSIAALRVLEQETDLSPSLVAGHSLGEYSAIVSSGALNFKDAVHTVRKRGEFMQSAVPVGIGSMAAVMGLSKEQIVKICEENSDDENVVSPANFNSPQQIVISGHKAAVEKVSLLLKEEGAKRVVPLTVSAPFHCSLMNKAAEELKEVLDSINKSEINVPVVSNVDAESNSDHNAITDLLFRQVVMPVRWYESVEYMKNQNINRFIEIGPGNVLTGLIRRTVNDVELNNLENLDHLNHINKNENRS